MYLSDYFLKERKYQQKFNLALIHGIYTLSQKRLPTGNNK
jgi:hypothetical protein